MNKLFTTYEGRLCGRFVGQDDLIAVRSLQGGMGPARRIIAFTVGLKSIQLGMLRRIFGSAVIVRMCGRSEMSFAGAGL